LEIETIALWTYLVYLFISIFLTSSVGILIFKNTGSFMIGILWAVLVNVFLIMFGITCWLIFCFTVDIGYAIETLPLGGIMLAAQALIINIPILFVTLLIYKKLKKSC